MRELATFVEQAAANQLANILNAKGIETRVDESKDSSWRLWVIDDGDVTTAKSLADEFADDPSGERWAELEKKGRTQNESASKKVKAKDSRAQVASNSANSMLPSWLRGIGRVTLGLMVVSIGFGAISSLGNNAAMTSHFTIASFTTKGEMVYWYGLSDLENGQLWRVFTPMLIHFGLVHLLFNMLWLKDLGSMIEREKKVWFLPLMVLVVSGISNVGQYYWPPMSPTFGGMSGVVYGLLGYVWMCGRFNPKARFAIPQTMMIWMMAWLVICFTGVVGPVANGAHVVGLAVGAIWGYLSSGHLKRLLRR